MILVGKLVGALLGRKLKEKAVDAVLDKVNLPDPVEASIKAAATGNIGELLADAGEAIKAPAAKKRTKK
jgi:hypothetical protein